MRHIADMAQDATIYPVKKLVNLTEEQAKEIVDFRFENRLASENEAIRQLIALGLEARRSRKKPAR